MTTTESVTTLTIDARGIVVEIPDSKGELRSYEAKRSPDGFDTYAVTLRRLDGDGDTGDGEGRLAIPPARRSSGPTWSNRGKGDHSWRGGHGIGPRHAARPKRP